MAGASADSIDKTLLGGAVVMGLLAPSGAKGPALRKIRSAFRRGKISREATSGLRLMARHAPEATKDLMKKGNVAEKVGTFLHDVAKTSPNDAARYSKLIGESAGKTIKTPYGDAVQNIGRAALDAREAVKNGAPLYRGVKNGVSNRVEAQFWSLEHPKSNGYADRYGIPPKNMDFDGVDTATVKKGGDFVTRPSPAVESNGGGSIEIVVNPGEIDSYTQSPF